MISRVFDSIRGSHARFIRTRFPTRVPFSDRRENTGKIVIALYVRKQVHATVLAKLVIPRALAEAGDNRPICQIASHMHVV